MSYLFQQVHPRHITSNLLAEVLKVIQENPSNRELQLELYTHFVCEFRLWIYKEYEFQREQIQTVRELIESETLVCAFSLSPLAGRP